MTNVKEKAIMLTIQSLKTGYYLTVAVSLVILLPVDNFPITRGISDDYPRSN